MQAESCSRLIELYKKNHNIKSSEKLIFEGTDGMDVYNITAPFEDNGRKIIAGRVEKRCSENSKAVFFYNHGNVWRPLEEACRYDLQDPFVCKIGNDIVFGGVKTYPHPEIKCALGYKTEFYKGSSIKDLKKFAQGPEMMKDIRLIELNGGSIGIFSRPQGKIGGRGKIGFTILKSLDDLNEEVINAAPLIENQFTDGEWGGTNELHILKNGLIGILGHIAKFDEEGNRHYYPMTCLFDPKVRKTSGIKIISVRDDIPYGDAKRPDLKDVLFSGGILRREDGYAELFLGVSDAEAYKLIIEDPFDEYEK